MDRHDIGDDRGGIEAALRALAAGGTRLTGVGIEDDILYGPTQVHALVDTAAAAGVDARYREIHSTKGHDAFLVEWDQLHDAPPGGPRRLTRSEGRRRVDAVSSRSAAGAWLNGRAPDSGSGGSRFESWRASQLHGGVWCVLVSATPPSTRSQETRPLGHRRHRDGRAP